MELLDQIDVTRLPKHIAIIMDGNGRWAKERGKPRLFGHHTAIKSLHEVTEACSDLKLKGLTLYAFSTENWNRPAPEVKGLMLLFGKGIRLEMDTMLKNNVRLNVIGAIDMVPPDTAKEIQNAMDRTRHCTGLTMTLAISYSGRWDILQATRKLAEEVKAGRMQPSDITEKDISDRLALAQLPDPELLIRTGGELRISNYMLWQTAYTELYFTEKYWPDFGKEDLYQAILEYQHRERRFGKTSEQIK